MPLKKENGFVLSLDRTTRVQQLNDWILSQLKFGHKNLTITVRESRTYSNVCAPIAGVIQYYREQGIKINLECYRNSYVRHTRIWNPLSTR